MLVKKRIEKWRLDVDFMTFNPERRSAIIDCRKELEEDVDDAASSPAAHAERPDKLQSAFVTGWREGFEAAQPGSVPHIHDALLAWEQHKDAFVLRAALSERPDIETIRRVLNTDLQIAQERVLTLELENQQLRAALSERAPERKDE
jgi:hypothetical protein